LIRVRDIVCLTISSPPKYNRTMEKIVSLFASRNHRIIVIGATALLLLGALFLIVAMSTGKKQAQVEPSPSARALTPEERRQELLNRLSAPENQPQITDEEKEANRQELLNRLSSPENQPDLSPAEKEAKRNELLNRLSAPENQ